MTGIHTIVEQLTGTSRIPASAAPRTAPEPVQREREPYVPTPGTLAARVCGLLAPGQSMYCRDIAHALGVSAAAVRSTCLTPVRYGVVRFERDEAGALVVRRAG